MTDYKASKRIVGTSAERTALTTIGVPNTSWKLLDSTKTSSGSSTINVTGFTEKDNLMVLCFTVGANSMPRYRVGVSGSIDTSSVYTFKQKPNGSGGGTTNSYSNGYSLGHNDGNNFVVINQSNIAGSQKPANYRACCTGGSGSNNDPTRRVGAGRYTANTSSQIDSVQLHELESGSFGANSEVVVLGANTDEADSGTNFWQELTFKELTSAGDSITTDTFSAKEYLMVEFLSIGSGQTSGGGIQFNDDTSANYSRRYNDNGSEATGTNESQLGMSGTINNSGILYQKYFIVNKDGYEKLLIGDTLASEDSSTTINRRDVYGKWDITSGQITKIKQINNGSGDFGAGSYIRVWGGQA